MTRHPAHDLRADEATVGHQPDRTCIVQPPDDATATHLAGGSTRAPGREAGR